MKQEIPEFITASFLKHLGLRNQAIADLKIYLARPVGVGEHGDISAVVDQKLKEIDDYDSIIDSIQRLFPNVQETIFGKSDVDQASPTEAPKQVNEPSGSSINGNSDEVFSFDKSKQAKITEEDLENSEG